MLVKDNDVDRFLSTQPNGDVLAITMVEVIEGKDKRVATVNAKLIELLNRVEINI